MSYDERKCHLSIQIGIFVPLSGHFLFFVNVSNHEILPQKTQKEFFLRHPEQLRLLQEDPTRIETAIDECLRYDCPGQYIARRALADIEIGGKTIQRGQRVVFVIGAANRDHAEFPEPDRFDICRSPNRYLTFGHGMRYCMGAHLARSVARIGVGTLVRRLPRIALRNESLEWEPSYRTHGLKALPVTFR
uniref:Cytochrome P450 n=1 Tax=Candidatus Kentrum sp. LPFa TaxID=2126335 RepID=A0A450X560_9GAMM|nr:MAG: Cytochrome P450 [Candidatus Kentron sp. LPFa]VFK24403.1 MAG: Cytochrome P450 [Candidatus Kentron sp. LPFa]